MAREILNGLEVTGTVDISGNITAQDGTANEVIIGNLGAPAIQFGGDTVLYRVAADHLKTDDAFTVVGALTASMADGYTQKTAMIEADTAFFTASTSTSMFSIAGLTNGPTSGFWPVGTYEFQADCYFTTNLATPLKFAILCRDSGAADATFTAGTLDYNVQHWKYTTATGAGAAVLPLKKYVATYDEATATTANVATTETIQVFIKGKITITEPATFLVRAGKTSASSGTLTCLSGSYLTVTPARL